MAISMNNHEQRLVAIEAKIKEFLDKLTALEAK